MLSGLLKLDPDFFFLFSLCYKWHALSTIKTFNFFNGVVMDFYDC